jgi:CheY-like chemotaxis protein/HPt (histidine-containing phosphotransfer) domain-containing protein
MGGEIGVESAPGQGSDFHFTARFGVPAAAPDPRPAMPPSLRDLRILVVDDSANSREILRDLLIGLGYRPVLASSGQEGLDELLRAAGAAPYDLVLLDWKMPDMDGFAVVEALRRSVSVAKLPRIVLVTAYGDDALSRRAAAENLAGCVSKPVSASSLMDAIASAFGRQRSDAPAARGPASSDSSERVAAPPALRGKRVLLVEDNEFNQIVAVELLRDVAGMQVSLAHDGRQAVALARTQPFDAVLMDIQMPGMDGHEATALIRQDARFAALPIIAMTAHAISGHRDQSLAAGMDDYVSKPFDPEDLFAVLARWLPAEDSGRAGAAVDVAQGLRHCGGQEGLYRKVVDRFLRTHDDDPSQLRAAAESGRASEASALAHDAVSAAGVVGAVRLSALARQLQVALTEGQARLWTALLEQFASEHAAVMAQLAHYLGERTARQAPSTSGA